MSRKHVLWMAGGGCLLVMMGACAGSVFTALFLKHGPAGAVAPQSAQDASRDGVSDGEKKAYEAFLNRNLPDPEGLQFLSWSATEKDGTRTILVQFRAKRTNGGKVIWDGLMTVENGKVTRKVAQYPASWPEEFIRE